MATNSHIWYKGWMIVFLADSNVYAIVNKDGIVGEIGSKTLEIAKQMIDLIEISANHISS